MSTEFSSVQEAKNYVALEVGLDPRTAVFTDAPGLKAVGLDALLLRDPDASDEVKARIQARIEAQQGFVLTHPKGNIKIVIGPFRDGFDCWVVTNSGNAVRL